MSKRMKSSAGNADFDRDFRAQVAQMTAGVAPTAFTTAFADWITHLALSPAKRGELRQDALMRANDTWTFALRAMAGAPLSPAEGASGAEDRRFEGEAWSQFPFNVLARAYQNNVALLNEAVRDVSGVSDYHAQLLEFAVRMTGVELRFSDPLDPQTARHVANYTAERWNYRWSGAYGSLDYSVTQPKEPKRDKVSIQSAQLSADGVRVYIAFLSGDRSSPKHEISW